MDATLSDLTTAMLDAAAKAGADQADAIAITDQSVSIDVRDGALETAERSESTDIGLRVLVGQRQATIAGSDLSQASLAEMAARAVAMAELAPEDPHLGLADPSELSDIRNADALDLWDDANLQPNDLEDRARSAEAAALAVTGVTQVQSASAGQTNRAVHMSASNGFAGGYRRSSFGWSAVAISGTGLDMERDYCGEGRAHLGDIPDPAEVGRIAGKRAVARAGAVKPPTGAYPVLYDERIASSLISHLSSAINGASVARGSSWLRDAMGDRVLPEGMDVIEDPHRARIGSSRMFDAEGLPTIRRAFVEDGVLRSWVLDLANARKLGLGSTANASRGLGRPPSPSLGGLLLTQGAVSRADLMAEMGEGLLITSLIGSSINPTTGDYSRGASGFWVKNGEISHPVNECTIAGNLRQMLGSLRAANDGRTHLSTVVPSLLVEGLTIAGA